MRAFGAALAASLALFSTQASALSNSARVPILTYHSANVVSPCDYGHNTGTALASDLNRLYERQITVVPVYWLVEWALGLRDGSTLPDKVVGITIDDGLDLDWNDLYVPGHDCGDLLPSARTIFQAFKNSHSDLPWYSPHASLFVIASPVARQYLSGGPGATQYYTDSWWSAAQNSGMFEIYNHSVDHDIMNFPGGPTWDPALGINLAVGGYYDGNWQGLGTFERANDLSVASFEVSVAAQYINNQIGVWPDLFATPFAVPRPGLQNYFANYWWQHRTLAAFGPSGDYLSRSSQQYNLPRFTHNLEWHSSTEFDTLLDNATY